MKSGILEGKICVVTGAAGGMGRVICDLFAKENAKVIGVEVRDGDWRWESEYKESIIPMQADISSEEEVRSLIAKVKKEYGRIDVLANVAGVEVNERIGFIKKDNMDLMFRANVFGTIEMLQYVTRVMMRQPEGGSIVNIASVVGVHGNPGQLVYSATKGAVISLTKTAAKELAPFKIRVNAIAPGMTNTPMIQNTAPEFLQKRLERIPMGRIAEPEDIANAVLFLASDQATYITGQILGVDGGTIM